VDANGSRFHLLLTREDWGRCTEGGVPLRTLWDGSPPAPASVAWNAAARELTLRPLLFRFLPAPADVRPALEQRRGAAADRFGNRYWIDETGRGLRVQSSGDGRSSVFWPPEQGAEVPAHGDFAPPAPETPPAPPPLAGLAVTEDHYLVAGVTEPPGLLVFDLFAGGEPTRLDWPREIPFVPFDMAPRPGGGLWILDRAHLRYWQLDRRFRVLGAAERTLSEAETESFQPAGAEPPRLTPRRGFPEGVTLEAASPVEAVDPIAIEALPDRSVLILDRDGAFSRVLRYRDGARLGPPLSLAPVAEMIEEDEREGFILAAHDFALLRAAPGSGEPDQLVVASAEGNQAFALRVAVAGGELALQPLPRYLPMRRFGGKGLLAAAGSLHYDFGDGWVPLTEQRRPRYDTHAEIETRAGDGRCELDSGEPDCVWHRLILDACIPPGAEVQVWSRAANDIPGLLAGEWRREPAPYPRGDGPELPWLLPRPGDKAEAQERFASWELLFQQARGRYLQLRLVITGNERATPRLRALRAWYPRFSYAAQYLPAVYREDAESAGFLERFLANLEGLNTALEDRVASVQALFDWRSAPAETLDWLAGWFEAVLDPAWDERRRRLFIAHAVDFFQHRGTIHGLRMALALALDPDAGECIFAPPGRVPEARQRYRVIERYLTRRLPPRVLGEPLRETGPREVVAQARWSPAEGGARLAQRYADHLQAATGTRPPAAPFPLLPPQDAEAARLWSGFCEQHLGFVPEAAGEREAWQQFLASAYGGRIADYRAGHGATHGSFAAVPLPQDLPAAAGAQRDWREYLERGRSAAAARPRRLWQEFLARRYRRIAALNAEYRTRWASFGEIPPPEALPADGAPLADWFQFETTVRTMHRHAHRFSVLVPTPGSSADLEQVRRDLALAERVIRLEKPAHTSFEVDFYWAMFRVGEARLGFDTLLDVGSRAPQLLPPLVLGRHFVGGSHLAPPPGHPGRERLTLECIPVSA
jgi:phage tail-like protein